MTPEEHLHLLGPYLPTDRFRAMLRGEELPFACTGAALLMDITGFTPLTSGLVAQHGARRGGEELKKRLNPMYETVAGQVFYHGGSVIRFTGDGFIAWFDDAQADLAGDVVRVPALDRAAAAGLEMQSVMRFFRGLTMKVAIGQGRAYRSVVGNAEHGVMDVLFGPAVEELMAVAANPQPGLVLAAEGVADRLRRGGFTFAHGEGARLIVESVAPETAQRAKAHRWTAWHAAADTAAIAERARPWLPPVLREQVEGGYVNFVGELREALPMFIAYDLPEISVERLTKTVEGMQRIVAGAGGRLVSIEIEQKRAVVFAVFGAPLAHGDDSERAVNAALALREWALLQNGGGSLRIGVSRGLLYSGIVGGEVRHEYSTIGDETNLAARLMMAAQAGQILATPRVRNDTRQRILYHDLTPINVKGREDSIAVSEPYARIHTGYRRSQRGEMVGRAAELAHAEKLLKALAGNMPRILRVEGQAGIGKSRLVTELQRVAVERGFELLEGDCLSTQRTTAWLPWRQIVLDMLGVAPDTDDAEDITARLSRALNEFNPEWAERLPLLLEVLGVNDANVPVAEMLHGETRRQAVIALICDLVLRYANRKPLVLTLEDIHWIDEVSEALAVELARRLTVEPEPILLVLAHRPQAEMDRALDIFNIVSEMYITSALVLTDLSQIEVAHLVEAHLKARPPAELTTFVYEKARGNPFFIKELLDTLSEAGAIRIDGPRAVIVRDLNASDLPRTVHEIVQMRIDRLSEMDKILLKVASVIGLRFPTLVLAESLPVSIAQDDLLLSLQRLEARDLIYHEEGDAELTYGFKHAIVQEVVYQSLLDAQQIALHHAVGEVLSRVAPQAVERLAWHFARANDLPNMWKYLRLAAERSLRDYANLAALGFLDEMLRVAEKYSKALALSDADLFAIRADRLRVLLRGGSAQPAQDELGELTRLAALADRHDWQAMILTFRAQYFMGLNRWYEALATAREAVTLAEAEDRDDLAWEAYMLVCDACRSLNMREALRDVLPRVYALTRRMTDPRKQIWLTLQEIDDLYLAEPERADVLGQAALALAEQVQDRPLIIACLEAIGLIHTRNNQRYDAWLIGKRQLDLLRQVGDRRGEGTALVTLGANLVHLGQLSEANAALLDGYKILHQIGAVFAESRALIYMGQIAAHRRAWGEGLAYALRGLAVMHDLGMHVAVARAQLFIGGMYLGDGDLQSASNAFTESRELSNAAGYERVAAEAGAALAEVALRHGEVDSARRQLTPILPRLLACDVRDLQQPGLAWWRAVQVLDRYADFAGADALRAAFREYSASVLARLPDAGWRDAYINSTWYHRVLLEPVYG